MLARVVLVRVGLSSKCKMWSTRPGEKTCSKSAKSIMYFVNNSMNTKDLETNKISQKYLVTFMDFGCPEQPNYLLINLGSFKQGFKYVHMGIKMRFYVTL